MKKIVSMLVFVVLILGLNSCKEQCEKDNTGEITIVNNSEQALWFDVTEGSSTNENRLVEAGATTTYTMPNIKVKVWASFTNEDAKFVKLKEMGVARCEEVKYNTFSKACLFMQSVDTITIVNNTGQSAQFNLWVNGGPGFQGEVSLSSAQTHSWRNVHIGSGSIRFQRIIGVDTLMTNNITVAACMSEYTHTWN